MTKEEYDQTDFVGKYFTDGLKVRYNDIVYDVVAWDEEERLIGIMDTQNSDEISYKRCENCKLL